MIHPLAGHPAPAESLTDIEALLAAYSERPGTPATHLADDVPAAEKRRRLVELLADAADWWLVQPVAQSHGRFPSGPASGTGTAVCQMGRATGAHRLHPA